MPTVCQPLAVPAYVIAPGRGQDGHMEVQGFADGRFGLLRAYFAEILAAQPGTGAAFAAWCDGRLVVDLWGGAHRGLL
jgi:hypothetical protein